MRRGSWHQFGDKSQRLALEQLQNEVGVGVILSPRDLSWDNALEYAPQYRALGAELLIDQQFYFPGFSNKKFESYPIHDYRTSVSGLNRLSPRDRRGIQDSLQRINGELGATALVAPSVLYEAGRNDIVRLNRDLYIAAKEVGDILGIPTYGTILLSRSVTSSDVTINEIISKASAENADGWYFGFEFERDGIPANPDLIKRCARTCLMLSCTGKPVLHAYAGPNGLLSLGTGATGVAIGHSQNLWQFTRERWENTSGQGGGGNAPPRYFSKGLWGTIIYPDEFSQLSTSLKTAALTPSPYSDQVGRNLDWGRWDANKHLVHVICSTIGELSTEGNARKNLAAAKSILDNAVALHQRISDLGLRLRDNSNSYQANWSTAIEQILTECASDYNYLEMLD